MKIEKRIIKKENKDVIKMAGIFDKGYGIVSKRVMTDKKLSAEAKAIYSFLCTFTGSENTAYPSVEYQCDCLNIGLTRYLKHRKKLLLNGYITITKTRQLVTYSDNTQKEFRDNNTYTIVTSLEEIDKIKEENESKTTSKTIVKIDRQIPSTPENTVFLLGSQNDIVENDIVENSECINTSLDNTSLDSTSLVNKERKKDKTEFDICIEDFSDNEEVRETIREFIKFRFSIGKKINTRGLKLALNKLDKLSTIDSIQVNIINNSIMCGWTQFFPIKEDKKDTKNTRFDVSTKNTLKFANYDQRAYDFETLEEEVYGFDFDDNLEIEQSEEDKKMLGNLVNVSK